MELFDDGAEFAVLAHFDSAVDVLCSEAERADCDSVGMMQETPRLGSCGAVLNPSEALLGDL
jgi:hypothetical protein